MKRYEHIEAVVCPVLTGLGYQFIGLEFLPQGQYSVLRVYINNTNGNISVDECAQASHQINAVLTVENPIQGSYTLEVSSPGIDKLLFTKEQMAAEIGNEILVLLQVPLNGKKRFSGKLERVDSDTISMIIDGEEKVFLFSDIDKARIVPKWEA